jgi:hypothetical protein
MTWRSRSLITEKPKYGREGCNTWQLPLQLIDKGRSQSLHRNLADGGDCHYQAKDKSKAHERSRVQIEMARSQDDEETEHAIPTLLDITRKGRLSGLWLRKGAARGYKGKAQAR